MSRQERRQFAKGIAFCSPWLVGFCVLTALPVGLSLYYSLCDYSLLQRPQFIGAVNYRMLAADAVFWKSLANTLYFALLAIPSAMAVSLGLAILLNVKIRGQSIYRTIIFLPSLVPIVASSMLWLWLLNGKLGLMMYTNTPSSRRICSSLVFKHFIMAALRAVRFLRFRFQ